MAREDGLDADEEPEGEAEEDEEPEGEAEEDEDEEPDIEPNDEDDAPEEPDDADDADAPDVEHLVLLDEDGAATRLQAAQRGKTATKAVAAKREERKEMDGAATRLQAAQRSRIAKQRVAERRKCRRAVCVRPRRQRRGAAARDDDLSGEELPLCLALAKELGVEQVQQVHRVGEAVFLEERARDRAEDELLEQGREHARALDRRGVRELLGGERLAEELEEHRQRVLVHLREGRGSVSISVIGIHGGGGWSRV